MKNKVTVNTRFLFIQFIFILLIIMLVLRNTNIHLLLTIIISYLGILSLIKPLFLSHLDSFSIPNLAPFMFMMYALGPLFYRQNYSNEIINKYLLFQLLGIISLIIGLNASQHNVVRSNDIQNNKIKIWKNDLSSLKLTAIIFVLLSFVSVLTEVIAFGGLAGILYSGYGLNRIEVLSNSSVIGGGFQWLILSSVLLGYTGYKVKSDLYKVVSGLIFIISFIVLFFTGGRSTVVYTLIFALVLYHYDIERIKLNKLIVYIFFGIAIAQLYSNARYYLPLGLGATISNTARIFMDDPVSFFPIPQNISEFQMPAKSLLDILLRGESTRFLGKSYINALGTPFPIINGLLSNFGVNIAQWFLRNYHLDVFLSGAGLGFSPVTEGYLNFGGLGIILHLFFFGFVGGKAHAVHKKYNNFITLLLYAGLTPIFILEGFRIHLSSAMYKLFRIYLFPLFIYIFVNYYLKQLSKKNSEDTI